MRHPSAGSAGERIEWITDDAGFRSLAARWERLAAGGPTPFNGHAWFAAWWKAFGAGLQMRVCTVWRDDALVAALPLGARGGRELEAMSNVHTPVLAPLASDAAALRVLMAGIAASSFDRIVIDALDSRCRWLRAVPGLWRRHGRLALEEPRNVSPIVDTSGDLTDYRRRMRPRWRELERRRRKMYREHDVRYEFAMADDALDALLDRGFAVEASGWKAESGTAIVSSPQTHAFYREVAHAFHAAGGLRLAGLWIDGSLVAFDLAVQHRDRLFLLKTGYDEAARRHAPGLALRLSVVESCFERGVQAYELLGDEMDWKALFATGWQPHCRLLGYRLRPVPLAGYAWRRSRPTAQRVYIGYVKPLRGRWSQ